MFKLAQKNTYTWPIKVQIPVDGGKFEPQTFDAEFKRLPQSEINDLLREIQDGVTDTRFVEGVLVGWHGVADADGNELPYSEAAKIMLLDIPYLRSAVVAAFFDSFSGGAARRKN